jgi:hypothetical protein
MTWVLLVAVGMTTRIAIAAPRAALAEFRALVCCAEHCPKSPRTPMTPRRCCGVESGATHPASTASAVSVERPTAPLLALRSAAPRLMHVQVSARRLVAASRRDGPPGHRDTLELRC